MPELAQDFDSKWLKAGTNVHEGDVIKFLDAGVKSPNKNNPDQNDINFRVSVSRQGEVIHEEKLFSLNASNFKAVSAICGTNSDAWVGKEFEIAFVNRQNPQTGKLVKGIALFRPEM